MQTRLSSTVATLGEIKEFIQLAETLGYDDATLVGNHHTGLDLYIEVPTQPTIYKCPASCGFETVMESMGRTADRQFITPHHVGDRGFNCSGAGKVGYPK